MHHIPSVGFYSYSSMRKKSVCKRERERNRVLADFEKKIKPELVLMAAL